MTTFPGSAPSTSMKPPVPADDPLPRVTFVIPVKNDALRLRRCLATIRMNDYPADRVEIIVGDNGSDDDSPAVSREAGATVLDLPGCSVGEIRNRVAEAASGDILAFVDADHEIAPDWIRCAASTLAAPDVAAVGALCEAPRNGTWVQQTYDLMRRRPEGVRSVEWLGSGNMAVWRTRFMGVGGFDTRLHTCEDVDLCRRLRSAGHRIMHDSRLRNVHLGDPSTLGELFRGELWRGRDNLRVSFRGPVTLGELPSVLIPVVEIGLVALALSALTLGAVPALALLSLAAASIVAFSGMRAAKMLWYAPRLTPLACGRAFAVATTYDIARAVALVRPHGYGTRRGARS
jgi:hypothetical protein